MTIPFLSFSVAMLYFGWLWHDRKATDRVEAHSISPVANALKPAKRSALRRLEVSRRTTFDLQTVPGRTGEGVIQ
jgi:hypothetical protein